MIAAVGGPVTIAAAIMRCAKLYLGPVEAQRIDRSRRGLQQRLRGILIRQTEHLAGRVLASVGRKPARQHAQCRSQIIANGNHGGASNRQRRWINRQGCHVRNTHLSRPPPLFTPVPQQIRPSAAAPEDRHRIDPQL